MSRAREAERCQCCGAVAVAVVRRTWADEHWTLSAFCAQDLRVQLANLLDGRGRPAGWRRGQLDIEATL